MRKIDYMSLPDCLLITNGKVEVIATTRVGPRVLAFRFHGEENIFGEHPEAVVNTERGPWKPYGGHRLWAAPESMPETYYPDNEPVDFQILNERSVRLIAPIEQGTNLRKEMRISVERDGATVNIEHLITNCGRKPVELAPWGLTIMRGGGTTIIPQEPYRSHDEVLLPARPMVLWPFTDLTDPRFTIGKRLIQLSTNEAMAEPQKIGVLNKQGWAAYYHDTTLFIKEMEYLPESLYPDYGCNTEAYTAGGFMELESLDIMQVLHPNQTASHEERWHLFRKVSMPNNEIERADEIETMIAKLRND